MMLQITKHVSKKYIEFCRTKKEPRASFATFCTNNIYSRANQYIVLLLGIKPRTFMPFRGEIERETLQLKKLI